MWCIDWMSHLERDRGAAQHKRHRRQSGAIVRKLEWFAAKTVFRRHVGGDDPSRAVFEERVVLIQAFDFDDAISKAEAEALRYAERTGPTYLGFVDAFHIGQRPGDGVEVFVVERESDLSDDAYIDLFHAQTVDLCGTADMGTT